MTKDSDMTPKGGELLRAEAMFKSYHDGDKELRILRGVDLTVNRGEVVAVTGLSGSGKSTLLHLLGGLDYPDHGRLSFEGVEFYKGDPPAGAGTTISSRKGERNEGKRRPVIAPRSQWNEFRNRKIGYVFQFHHLLPEFTALENIMIPGIIAGGDREALRARAMGLLEGIGLADRAKHRPAKLSGGEQQRIALARALCNEPLLMLADEPTGNLDPYIGENVIKLMWDLTRNLDRALVIVTHEPSIAIRADRILTLADGQLHPTKHEDVEARMMAGK